MCVMNHNSSSSCVLGSANWYSCLHSKHRPSGAGRIAANPGTNFRSASGSRHSRKHRSADAFTSTPATNSLTTSAYFFLAGAYAASDHFACCAHHSSSRCHSQNSSGDAFAIAARQRRSSSEREPRIAPRSASARSRSSARSAGAIASFVIARWPHATPPSSSSGGGETPAAVR
eukprot:30821-Pelagococcus_subviridis.AAC.25